MSTCTLEGRGFGVCMCVYIQVCVHVCEIVFVDKTATVNLIFLRSFYLPSVTRIFFYGLFISIPVSLR